MTSKPPITDSPWFWVYLFGSAAIILVALEAPKFSQRQAQIERKGQGRMRAAQQVAGQSPDVELSTPAETTIDLKPILILVGAATLFAWIILWQQRWNTKPSS